MRVLAVVNRKGGVGKTTTAVNIAAALALLGQRTLLVDLDPQGSAGHSLAVGTVDDAPGASAGFRGRAPWRVVYPAVAGLHRLGVVPADDPLASADDLLRRDPERASRLVARLAAERERWAIAVLDTPPALGGLATAALQAADGVLVPVAADYLAIEALRGSLEAIRAIEKERGRRFTPLAVLPTFVDRQRTGAAAAARLLVESFGDLVLPDVVPRSARFDTSAITGIPVVVSAPESAPAVAYTRAARTLLGLLGDERAAPRRRGAVKGFVRADMRIALRALRRA